jgi:hypothetical protein
MRKLIFYLTITLLTATILTQGTLAQTRYLNGTVKDENGNALSAATVSVKNSKVSMVSWYIFSAYGFYPLLSGAKISCGRTAEDCAGQPLTFLFTP